MYLSVKIIKELTNKILVNNTHKYTYLNKNSVNIDLTHFPMYTLPYIKPLKSLDLVLIKPT